MKFTLLTAALATVALASPVPAGQDLEARQSCTATLTNTYSFSYSISNFLSKRNAQSPACFDWSSDGCSNSPDNPFGYNFLNSCYRHDFGYRNFKKQNRFTEANKLSIDNKFKSDMYNQCAAQGAGGTCTFFADTYYNAVRAFGLREAEAELERKFAAEAQAEAEASQ